MLTPNECFIFEGIKPHCVQGRLINIQISLHERALVIKEYDTLPRSCGDRFYSKKQVFIKHYHCLKLPGEFHLESVVGGVICIGCVGDLFICQYICSARQSRYVKFLIAETNSQMVSLFEDTHHFFNRDSAAVSPLECLLSPDKTVCLLRLSQSILSPKKWSKLLLCKTVDDSTAIGPHNTITGTSQSKFRDRKFQLLAFDPLQPCRLVMLLLDSYCSKCKISVHDLALDKEVVQCTRKLLQSEKQCDTESDSDDEELVYFFLHDCSIVYNRSGETFLISCILTDNLDNSVFRIYYFSSASFELIGSRSFSSGIFPLKKSEILYPELSACDSEVILWSVEKNSEQFEELFRCNIPKPINLKSLCRSVIIRHMKSHSHDCAYSDLPLPPSLITYLQFTTSM